MGPVDPSVALAELLIRLGAGPGGLSSDEVARRHAAVRCSPQSR